MQRDQVLILDILAAGRMITSFTSGYDESSFNSDEKTQSATLHQLMIIGEAVKGLSIEFRAQHAEIPWRDMSRMRDILIHRYHNVDLHTVWTTVVQDIPTLLAAIEPLATSARDTDSVSSDSETL
jgi:uncharacterized protein with HEPN domain